MARDTIVLHLVTTIERVDCPLCGEAGRRLLPHLRYETPEGLLRLWRCGECGLVFQSPRLTQEELSLRLSSSYFEEGGYSGGHHARSYFDPDEIAEKRRHAFAVLDEIHSMTDGRRLLEVGAAGGHFLLAARERGFSVAGVELSPYAAKEAQSRYGLDLCVGQLGDAAFPEDSFDVLYLNDVLEHVPDPVDFLGEARRVLAPGGIFYGLIPTYIDSLPTRVSLLAIALRDRLHRLRGVPVGPPFLPEPWHLWEFNSATLRRLFARCGYDLVSMRSFMPSISSRSGSSLSGLKLRTKIVFMRGFAAAVKKRLLWGERTCLVARRPL